MEDVEKVVEIKAHNDKEELVNKLHQDTPFNAEQPQKIYQKKFKDPFQSFQRSLTYIKGLISTNCNSIYNILRMSK